MSNVEDATRAGASTQAKGPMETLSQAVARLEAEGYLLPVLEAHAAFKRPARFDDRVSLETVIAEPPRARVRLEYTVTLEGKALATGWTIHGFMSPEGRAIKPPDGFTAKIDAAFA